MFRAEREESSRTESVCRVCYNGGTEDDPLVAPCECHRMVHFGCMTAWKRLYNRCVRCCARNRMFFLWTPRVEVPVTRQYVLRPHELRERDSNQFFSEDYSRAELFSAILIGALVMFAVGMSVSMFIGWAF